MQPQPCMQQANHIWGKILLQCPFQSVFDTLCFTLWHRLQLFVRSYQGLPLVPTLTLTVNMQLLASKKLWQGLLLLPPPPPKEAQQQQWLRALQQLAGAAPCSCRGRAGLIQLLQLHALKGP